MKCKLLTICLVIISLCACRGDRPSGVLSASEMEDVLFDYHLAQGFSFNKADTKLTQDEIMEAFYEKHHITKADFDSSMVWYARHSDELSEIYKSLDKRMTEASEAEGIAVAQPDGLAGDLSISGDTMEIWNESRLEYLSISQLKTTNTFTIEADSSYHQKDFFRLQFNVHFLTPPSKERQNGLSVGLVVCYVNDSISATYRGVTSNQKITMTLHADSALAIKRVTGFFSLNKKESSPALIDNIHLMKFHTQGKDEIREERDEEKPSDRTVIQDSLPKDSLDPSQLKPIRMTPQQLRDSKPVERKVKIRKR